ncbi:MAG: DUF2764 family protein [Gimesia chilikensis]|uniref:DUF2764 family protein n=1 Tax=Gimesia chilikensis TaxID=2605989 RepID=UPI0037938953
MYYDLIASLPQIPHFTRAERMPITQLRLIQRLKLLKPEHARQLQEAHSLVRWRPEHVLGSTDVAIVREFEKLMTHDLNEELRSYVKFRLELQTLIAALRHKRRGVELNELSDSWGIAPRVHLIRRNWDVPHFGLTFLHPWFSQACQFYDSEDALELEQLLMDVTWRRLTQCAEHRMFGFEAVFAYVFKWNILEAWLQSDADRGKIRFKELIDQVTHVENN